MHSDTLADPRPKIGIPSISSVEFKVSSLAGLRLIPLSLLGVVAVAAAFIPTAAPLITGGAIVPADVAWMLTATGLVLLMTPGLAFFYGGMVQRKNVVSTMLQSFFAMGLVSLVWIVVGFSLSFGESVGGLIGNPFTFLFFRHVGGATHPDLSPTIPLALFALFQLKFAIITPALITGAFAERVRFSAVAVFSVLFSLLVYAPLAHWTWHPAGFLRAWGVLDFAGGTVVHMSAGLAALAGVLYLGRRRDPISAPANLPYVMLGTGMLWFGWFGFNAGSALAANETAVQAFLCTNTASAAAMLTWAAIQIARGEKITAMGACVGAVVGLVAITPAAGFVTVGQSVLIGAIASAVSHLAVHLKGKSDLDDTLDVFPCHGIGGIVGMILTGVFAANVGLVNGKLTTFLMHLAAVGIVTAFTIAVSYLCYAITNRIVPFRADEASEAIGLDLSQHNEQVEA